MVDDNERYLHQIIGQLQKDIFLLREYSISLTKSTTTSMSEISVLKTNINQLKQKLDEIKESIIPLNNFSSRFEEEHIIKDTRLVEIEKEIKEIQSKIMPLDTNFSVYKEQIKTKFLIIKILFGLLFAMSVGAITINDYKFFSKIFGGP